MRKKTRSFLLGVLLLMATLPPLVYTGIITLPNTFTGETAPQLPWLDANFNAVVSEINGNLDNANIKSSANISQSKIQNLVSDLAARLLKAGGTMTGALTLRFANPHIRLTQPGGDDLQILENQGVGIQFSKNTGTEAVPVWSEIYRLALSGTPTAAVDLTTKAYVDGLVAQTFGQVKKSDGDFSTASTSFVDVTGLSVNITTRAKRARVTFVGVGFHSNGNTIFADLQVDGVSVGGTDGLISVRPGSNSSRYNLSFSFITDSLSAASHTFKIRLKVEAGTGSLLANSETNAILQVEELPY